MVVGDQKRFLGCLLTLKTEIDPDSLCPLPTLSPATLAWLAEKADIRDAINIDDLLGPNYSKLSDAIQLSMDKVNSYATSNAQKVQKWRILKKDFSIPGGELGPTLKLKRGQVLKMYDDTINGFYKDS